MKAGGKAKSKYNKKYQHKYLTTKDREDIQRAFGVLQGLSYITEQAISQGILDALELLKDVLDEDSRKEK